MAKKNKFLLIGIPIIATTAIATGIAVFLTTSTISNNSNNNNNTSSQFIPSGYFRKLNNAQTQTTSNDFYYEKIINNNVNRPNNVLEYQTDLIKKHTSFKYPGYNFDYQTLWNMNNKKPDILSKITTMYNEVMAEVVPNTNGKTKYNDADWILSEIKNNTFKKHPAASNFHDPSLFVLNSTPAIEKEFILGTAQKNKYNTGMYAPAGEVITITFDQDTYELMKSTNFTGLSFGINGNLINIDRPIGNSGMFDYRYPYLTSWFNLNWSQNPIIDPQTRSMKIGSPFGGSICIKINDSLILKNQKQKIKFSISGGIQELHYVQGFTTAQDWENQKTLFKNKQITAPFVSVESNYFVTSFQIWNKNRKKFTDITVDSMINSTIPNYPLAKVEDAIIGGHDNNLTNDYSDIINLKYPYENIEKWDNFLLLSLLIAGYDTRNDIQKETFNITDQVWNDAAGYGATWNLYVPADTGYKSIFGDIYDFNPVDNWLMMHEINHGFTDGKYGVNNVTHAPANVPTIANVSLLSDFGRFRNPICVSGVHGSGWTYLTSPWLNLNSCDEYTVFSDFIYNFGIGKFYEYTRYANKMPKKGGLDLLVNMSNIMKLNLYNTYTKSYDKKWSDNWPLSYQNATLEQKKLIDSISSYKNIDFVSNLYASTPYWYNADKNIMVEGSDIISAFEIPTGTKSYNFYFDKFIKAKNNSKFDWNNLKFDPTTKLGGTLKLDPTNNKRLIYYPNPNQDLSSIDEFTISITPSFDTMPNNYVPEYKWKIKIRQEAKRPVVSTTTNEIAFEYSPWNIEKIRNSINNDITTNKISFNFIVPENNTYNFVTNTPNKLKINNEIFNPNKQYILNKNDVLLVEYEFGKNFDLKIQKNNTDVDFFKHSVSSYIDKTRALEIYNNKNIDYKIRKLPVNGTGSFGYFKVDSPTFQKYKPIAGDQYKFINCKMEGWDPGWGPVPSKQFDGLKEENHHPMRLNTPLKPGSITSFTVKFNQPQEVGSLVFLNPNDNYGGSTPKSIKVTTINSKGERFVETANTNDDYWKYGDDDYFLGNDGRRTYLNFKENRSDIVEIEIEMKRRNEYLALDFMNIYPKQIDRISNVITSDNNFINYDNNWINEITNNTTNVANFNYHSKYTNQSSSLTFKFKGNAFYLNGFMPSLNKYNFQINIDGQNIDCNIDNTNNISAHNIFSWKDTTLEDKEHIVTIKYNSNLPLYLNYIGLDAINPKDYVPEILKLN